MDTPVESGGDGGSGGTIVITSPTLPAPISPKVVENHEPNEMEKLTNWEKYYGSGEGAGASTTASSTQTATGILSLFGVLILLGSVLRFIV